MHERGLLRLAVSFVDLASTTPPFHKGGDPGAVRRRADASRSRREFPAPELVLDRGSPRSVPSGGHSDRYGFSMRVRGARRNRGDHSILQGGKCRTGRILDNADCRKNCAGARIPNIALQYGRRSFSFASYAEIRLLLPGKLHWPRSEPSPTFRAASKLVEVDVVARSKGAPATGLLKDDFTLFDNGKPQKIAFFSVRVGANPSWNFAAPPLPAGAVSNRLGARR